MVRLTSAEKKFPVWVRYSMKFKHQDFKALVDIKLKYSAEITLQHFSDFLYATKHKSISRVKIIIVVILFMTFINSV
jgi:hypothetical protein